AGSVVAQVRASLSFALGKHHGDKKRCLWAPLEAVGKMNNYSPQGGQKFLPSLAPDRFGQIEHDGLEDPVLPAVAEEAVAAGYLLPGDRLAGGASLELVDLVAVAVALEVAIILLYLGHEPRHGQVPDTL